MIVAVFLSSIWIVAMLVAIALCRAAAEGDRFAASELRSFEAVAQEPDAPVLPMRMR